MKCRLLCCCFLGLGGGLALAAKAVERAALALERVDDVHRRDGLATRVLGVRHGVTNHVLEEHLEHAARLLVNEVRDALHAATTSETTNSWLCDTLWYIVASCVSK